MKGPGWGVPEEALRLLPGPAFEVEQAADDNGLPVERPVAAADRKTSPGVHLAWRLPSSRVTGPRLEQCPSHSWYCNKGVQCMHADTRRPCYLHAKVHATWHRAGHAGGALRKKRRVVLVVFIGGVTFAEVAALRWLGARPEVNCAFVVATTKLVNGTSLLESFVDEDAHAALQAAALA